MTVTRGGAVSRVTLTARVNVPTSSVTTRASVYGPSGARDPSASVPSQVSDCGPAGGGESGGAATTRVPRNTCKASWTGARASVNPIVALPRETAEVKLVRMSSTTSWTMPVAVFTAAVAVTTTVYLPFPSAGGSVSASVWVPAGFSPANKVDNACPAGSTRLAVTLAAA